MRSSSVAPVFAALLASALWACGPSAEATSAPTADLQPAAAPAPPAEAAPGEKAAQVHGGQLVPGHSPLGVPLGHPPRPGRPASLGGLPAGHPPVPTAPRGGAPAAPFAPMAKKAVAVEDGHPMPLPLVGPGSIQELKTRLSKLPDGDLKTQVEKAFRLTFCADRNKRDVREAARLLEGARGDATAAPTAERILGYVAVSSGFDVQGAFAHYRKAVELEPSYGEAHYALSFLHAMKDREQGKVHYERALALGVPDVRGLSRFYGDPGSGR